MAYVLFYVNDYPTKNTSVQSNAQMILISFLKKNNFRKELT